MMRKTVAAIAVAGSLLAGIAAATPALAQSRPITLPCSPGTNGTYSITVGPPPPLTITFPSPCCNAGTVGSAYFQNFFSSGGIGPFTWTAAAGKLPPGVVLTGNHLGGTPTVVGMFTFTIKVTDSAGDQATEPGSITISP